MVLVFCELVYIILHPFSFKLCAEILGFHLLRRYLKSKGSARLPPMCPGFDPRTRRHMWVEFVVGSLPCSERFFSGYSGFPLSSKTNISKFQLIWNCQALYHEPQAGVIAPALPVFDIKFAFKFAFTFRFIVSCMLLLNTIRTERNNNPTRDIQSLRLRI